MVELSPRQMSVIERLLEAGFRPITIPPYENVICMKKGECAAVLAPVPQGGLKLAASPSHLVDGNLSVKLRRGSGEVFVWKKSEVTATPDRLSALDDFRVELNEILNSAGPQ